MKTSFILLIAGLQLISVLVGILIVVFGKKLCLNEICTSLARDMEARMNKNINPCEDFYSFACGGKPESNIRDIALREGLKRIIDVLQESPRDSDINVIKQVKEFYKKCTSEYFDASRAKSLFELFKVLGGFPTVEGPSWEGKNWSWVDTAKKAWQLGLRTDCLFKLRLMPNFYNSSKLIYSVALPVYPSSGVSFAQLVKLLAVYRPSTDDTSKEELMMNNLEVEINIMTQKAPSELGLQHIPRQMKLKEVKVTFDYLDWDQVISMVERSDTATLDELDIIIECPDYLTDLQILYETLSNTTLANYIMWGYLSQLRAYLTDDDRSSTIYCYSLLKETMPIALQAMYVDKWPGTSYDDEMTDITWRIKSELILSVKHSVWMDIMTKEMALDKIENILLRIGYPKEFLNPAFINKRYHNLTLGDSFLYSILTMKKTFLDMYYNIRFKENDRSFVNAIYLLVIPIYSANAFYGRNDNSMNILQGILTAPYFDARWPQCAIYGGIGSLVGRELIHAVDATGRLYDQFGMRKSSWWSPETQKKYKEIAACFIDQYSNFTFFDNPLRGDLQLQENAADSGGIRLSFLAYKKLPTSFFHRELGLPVLNLNPSQIFFLTFAQKHCHQYHEEDILAVMDSIFAPENFRVIGSLQNTRYFSDAFGCESGTNMNRKKKCVIW